MKFTVRAACLALTAGLSGCQSAPVAFAPPEQRPHFEEWQEQPDLTTLVDVGDASGRARFHIVQDIDQTVNPGGWSWTGRRPTVKIRLGDNTNLKFTMDFAVAAQTFKDTGPVTLSFFVNDHLLDRVRYANPGQKHFEKPVPRQWLTSGMELTLATEIDKVWVSKDDGTRFGFILVRMGLAP